jgi:DNA-directed RNA polymerase subunit RPC12/RpoP
MQLSELIKELEGVYRKRGDMPVTVHGDSNTGISFEPEIYFCPECDQEYEDNPGDQCPACGYKGIVKDERYLDIY